MKAEISHNNQIYLTYYDEEKLPYVIAYIKKFMPTIKMADIVHIKENDYMESYFILELKKENIIHRSVINLKLYGEIAPDSIAEQDRIAKLLSRSKMYETERILIVNPDCDTSMIPNNFKIICLNEIVRYNSTVA